MDDRRRASTGSTGWLRIFTRYVHVRQSESQARPLRTGPAGHGDFFRAGLGVVRPRGSPSVASGTAGSTLPTRYSGPPDAHDPPQHLRKVGRLAGRLDAQLTGLGVLLSCFFPGCTRPVVAETPIDRQHCPENIRLAGIAGWFDGLGSHPGSRLVARTSHWIWRLPGCPGSHLIGNPLCPDRQRDPRCQPHPGRSTAVYRLHVTGIGS